MKKNKHFIFVGGLHKGGTSILHSILRSHPSISGFKNTGILEDEGQHLQNVYPSALAFGGPGRFGFRQASFMDENHPLATPESAHELIRQWEPFWDYNKDYLIEKSPPNIVRTRFLQSLFPTSRFIIILRHPIAVAYATKKWRKKMSITTLIDHSLRCYERFYKDYFFLKKVYVLRYEELVREPIVHIGNLCNWIGLEAIDNFPSVHSDINDKYFSLWRKDQQNKLKKVHALLAKIIGRKKNFGDRAAFFGYSMETPEKLSSISWLSRKS